MLLKNSNTFPLCFKFLGAEYKIPSEESIEIEDKYVELLLKRGIPLNKSVTIVEEILPPTLETGKKKPGRKKKEE